MEGNKIDFDSRKVEMEYADEYDDEEWEADANYYYNQDWQGLVELRLQMALKNPEDVDCQWRLGEAYVLNKNYDKALIFLSELHKQEPEDPNIQQSLLDALFATGKDESSIDWVVDPNVLRLNRNILEYCYDYLKKKREPKAVYELYTDLYAYGYPAFDDKQLLHFLFRDKRFQISDVKAPTYDCFISVGKNK